jgi:hypothetical protein
LDLTLVLEAGLPPLEVPLHTRRVSDPQLLGHVRHQLRRCIQWVDQEHPQMPHREDLQGEAQTAVNRGGASRQLVVLIIEVEKLFQLDPREDAEAAVAAPAGAAHLKFRRPSLHAAISSLGGIGR